MFRVVLGALKAVRESRECHAHDNRVLALGDNGTVIDLDILDVVVGEDDARHRCERNKDVAVLFCILIIYVDFDLARLTRQILRRDFLAVQIVGDLLGDRSCLVCCSLIIDVISAGVPSHHIAVLRKGLIPFDVLDILQNRVVIELVRAVFVLEPAGDSHTLLLAAGVCEDIYGLFLLCAVRLSFRTFYSCCHRSGEVLFRDRGRLFRVPENASGNRSRRCKGRHGHICCHCHCKKQGQNLFSLHDPISPLLTWNGTARRPDSPVYSLSL